MTSRYSPALAFENYLSDEAVQSTIDSVEGLIEGYIQSVQEHQKRAGTAAHTDSKLAELRSKLTKYLYGLILGCAGPDEYRERIEKTRARVLRDGFLQIDAD